MTAERPAKWADVVAPIVRKCRDAITFGLVLDFKDEGREALAHLLENMARRLDILGSAVCLEGEVMTRERAREILVNELRKAGFPDYAAIVARGSDDGCEVAVSAIVQACKEAALNLCRGS